jgi:hypothetical protein
MITRQQNPPDSSGSVYNPSVEFNPIKVEIYFIEIWAVFNIPGNLFDAVLGKIKRPYML